MNDRQDIQYMFSDKGKFGDPAKAVDLPLSSIPNPDPSVTETWWFQFSVPDRRLNGEIYLWIHSNLKMASGGVWIYQGVKSHHLEAEHFNFRNYLPYPQQGPDSVGSPELGLGIRVIEPLTEYEVRYADEASGTVLSLNSRAVGPIAMRSNDAHLEQPMRTRGTLRLDGEEIAIDCMSMRDRSWGTPRPEVSMNMPPTCWAVGITRDGSTAFNFSTSDDPTRNPVVAGFGRSREELFRDGWIWREGVLRKIVSASNLTVRDGLRPVSYDCTITDDGGRDYRLKGRVLASIPWSPWPNMYSFFGNLTEWRLDDAETLYGDSQEVFWAPTIKAFRKAALAPAG